MGIFHEMVEVVNRTSEPLMVMFDGQRTYLQPNYNEIGDRIEGVVNLLPKQVIPYALNQNVIMGSEEVSDPTSFRSYVGVVERDTKRKKHSWHDCSFVERETREITRVSREQIMEEYVADPKAKFEVRGKVQPRGVDAALGVNTTPFDIRSK